MGQRLRSSSGVIEDAAARRLDRTPYPRFMLATAGRSDDTRGRKPPGRKRPMERIDRRRLLGGVLNGEVVERVVEAGGRRPCAQEGDAMKIAACPAALGAVILVLVSCLAPAHASEIDQRCGVFARGQLRLCVAAWGMGHAGQRHVAVDLSYAPPRAPLPWSGAQTWGRMRNGDQERYSGESHRTTLRETRRANTAPNTPLNSTKS